MLENIVFEIIMIFDSCFKLFHMTLKSFFVIAIPRDGQQYLVIILVFWHWDGGKMSLITQRLRTWPLNPVLWISISYGHIAKMNKNKEIKK